MANEKIKKLCEYMDKNKAKNYPIYNQCLNQETDYIKNAYFKMLAVILQQAEISNEQRNLFGRMIAGMATDYTEEDYLRQALEIEIKEYVDFTEQCKEMSLKYRFLLDALLLTALDNKNQDQLSLVANFMEALKLQKNEVEYLAMLARSILEQSSSLYIQYIQSEDIRPKSINYIAFLEYTELFVSGILCNTTDEIYIQSSNHSSLDWEQIQETNFKQRDVTLKNLIIDMKEVSLSFTANENVKFENCEFIGENHSITFTACKKIEIEKCTFRDFKTKTIIENGVGEIFIVGCKFINCQENYSSSYDNQSHACVIFTENSDKNGINIITQTEFKECGGTNREHADHSPDGFISNCQCQVSQSKFYNCWYYSRGLLMFQSQQNLYCSMFNHKITTFGEGNEVIGSANLHY